jgi:thiamine-phosphate pyrophosphorylase
MAIKFSPPRFYPIIDTAVLGRTPFSPIRVAEEAVKAGAKILQYRHKEKWTQAEFDEAKAISAVCKEAAIPFIINDRADFAKLLGAGLHIGQDDLPPEAARKLMQSAVIGYSTHNAGQLRGTGDVPADYVSLGPIFQTTSKEKPDPVVHPDGIRAMRSLTSKPLVAIGGITLENASEVLTAGADSVAIISAMLPIEKAYKRLSETLKEWCQL